MRLPPQLAFQSVKHSSYYNETTNEFSVGKKVSRAAKKEKEDIIQAHLNKYFFSQLHKHGRSEKGRVLVGELARYLSGNNCWFTTGKTRIEQDFKSVVHESDLPKDVRSVTSLIPLLESSESNRTRAILELEKAKILTNIKVVSYKVNRFKFATLKVTYDAPIWVPLFIIDASMDFGIYQEWHARPIMFCTSAITKAKALCKSKFNYSPSQQKIYIDYIFKVLERSNIERDLEDDMDTQEEVDDYWGSLFNAFQKEVDNLLA